MILESGNCVLVTHRRLFEGDHSRYFVGTVEGYEGGVARVTGHTWIRDGYSGQFKRKEDARTKIISLSSGTVIVYQLPSKLSMETMTVTSEKTNTFLRHPSGFEMDLTEGVLQGGEPRTRRSA